MSETVDSKIRDAIMEKIIAVEGNNVCFDCGSKAPKWSSPYLGILICYECAARHRSYGTHISFVRSVNLDKWNRRQLKSLEMTGNKYAKSKFNEMGIPLIGSVFDYNNPLVLKYRAKIEEMVKENLGENEFKVKNDEENEGKKEKKKGKKEGKSKEKKEGNECENIGNKEENDGNKDKSNFKEVEDINDTESVPQKFEIKNNVNVKEVKVEKRAGKKNKIKKVDFDFDFDSFNDVNFSDFNKKENEEGETAPKKGKKKQAESDDEDDDDKEKKENERENRGGNGTKLSKEEISKKFAGKKAVSSEDYAALNDNGSQDKAINDRIKSFGKVTSISSSDVYGTEDDVYEGETFGSKMKDFAINLTLSAAEKAKEWKNKTNEIINSIQSKFTGY